MIDNIAGAHIGGGIILHHVYIIHKIMAIAEEIVRVAVCLVHIGQAIWMHHDWASFIVPCFFTDDGIICDDGIVSSAMFREWEWQALLWYAYYMHCWRVSLC